MAGFCLHKDDADKFRRALKDGTIDPARLIEMTSDERRAFFKPIVGEANAGDVNALFESKLLLKNQQQGLINWARKTGGMTPRVRRSIMSRIDKMDKVLAAKEEKTFLKDLAAQKLGLGIDFEEAKAITELTQKVREAKTALENGTGDRLDYGRAQVALNNYVNDLKLADSKTTLRDLKERPVSTIVKGVSELPGITKSIQAAFDNSALFRQGWKTLFTNPLIWQRNARRSFADIANTIKGDKTVGDEAQADIVSRPNYDLYKRGKLDVGNLEEAFPTHLPEKVPGLGRLYKASEVAYTNFLHKTRADIFDKMIDIARRNGKEFDDTELVQVGRLVNSLTGRGNLGHAERALSTFNTIFFSPRNVKAHFDTLLHPITGGATTRELSSGETGSNFVRQQAAYNLLKAAAGTAAILAIASFLKPDSVEKDPRSANFGKIKIGNTRFDVTGGMGSLLVWLSRMATGQSKSSVEANKVTDLSNPKFGQPNRFDVTVDFLANKLSPMMGIVRDYGKGRTFDNKKPTVAGEALSAITPLPVKTFQELLKDPEAKKDPRFIAFAQAMDMLGMSVNTYHKEPFKKNPEPDLDLEKILDEYYR